MSFFTVIIPARFYSSRLPGKPLCDIGGRPMVQWVHQKAVASGASSVIIATDDTRIKTLGVKIGAHVCMTDQEHPTGTDRLCEVVQKERLHDDDIIINVQGDEPFIDPALIRQVAKQLRDAPEDIGVTTLCSSIDRTEAVLNPNIVKVVRDQQGNALYFSRAVIPGTSLSREETASYVERHLNLYKRHIGIYGYRVKWLKKFFAWSPCPLEDVERLEQLRFLWHGCKIRVHEYNGVLFPGIDTEEDLARARQYSSQKHLDHVMDL